MGCTTSRYFMLLPPGEQTTAGSSAVRMDAVFLLLPSCHLVGRKHNQRQSRIPSARPLLPPCPLDLTQSRRAKDQGLTAPWKPGSAPGSSETALHSLCGGSEDWMPDPLLVNLFTVLPYGNIHIICLRFSHF